MRLLKLYIVVLIPLFLIECNYYNNEADINYFKNQNYKGIVVEKFQDWDNHGIEKVRIFNLNQDTIEFDLANWRYDNIWDYIQPGDSLIKPLNHLAITIKRKGEPPRKFRYLGVGYSL